MGIASEQFIKEYGDGYKSEIAQRVRYQAQLHERFEAEQKAFDWKQKNVKGHYFCRQEQVDRSFPKKMIPFDYQVDSYYIRVFDLHTIEQKGIEGCFFGEDVTTCIVQSEVHKYYEELRLIQYRNPF